MITKIFIDGFRSLKDFTLELNEGLNILVGPNGSGKTNIISFFEFLGNLLEMNVADAVSNSGGLSSCFTKIGENKIRSEMEVKIYGNIELSTRRHLFYIFSFRIKIMTEDVIAYSRQRIKCRIRTVRTTQKNIPNDFDLDVETKSEDGLSAEVLVHELNRKKIKTDLFLGSKRAIPKEQVIKYYKDYCERYFIAEESLIITLRVLFEQWRNIYADLNAGRIFNIIPSSVKIPEDSAKEPRINNDGTGLYATLYALNKPKGQSKYGKNRIAFLRRRTRGYIGKVKIDDIEKYLRLANDSILNLKVFNNAFDNQLQVHFVIKSGDGKTVLPLSAMSDGTIKWLALITVILTRESIFSIEEPENYLHPLMQQEIVNLMREHLSKEQFILMSTHSETILNNAFPKEIIVVCFKNGRTSAARPNNADIIMDEIQKTGFGLGYYYIAGNLEND